MANPIVEIKGLAELERRLLELPAKIEKNFLRGALRAGAKAFEEEAKRRVPVRSGKLRDSIRVSVRMVRGNLTAQIKAGGGKNAVAYAHLVERGTSPHVITAAGAGQSRVLSVGGRIIGMKVEHPGAAAKPFMRPAFDTQVDAAIKGFAEYLSKRLNKNDMKWTE